MSLPGEARVAGCVRHDLLAMFVERGIELLRPGGRLGALASRTGFFLSSYQRWRE